MGLLSKYRQHLADEAAGRSHRLRDILGYFRKFWLGCIFGGVAFMAYGVWVGLTRDLSGGAGMALIVFPVGALLLSVFGAVVYGLAQLFLSVKPAPESDIQD